MSKNDRRNHQYYHPRDFLNISSSFCSGVISLCSGAGIGEMGIDNSEETPLCLAVAVEINKERARLLQGNFPKCRVIQKDIADQKTKRLIATASKESMGKRRPFAVLLTPPCQGFSPNGQGRMKKARRAKGTWNPEKESRNVVVVHCLDVVENLLPAWVVFENVAHIRSKSINVPLEGNGRKRSARVMVIDYMRKRLEKLGYFVHVSPHGFDLVNFGVPQRRLRLFLVAERHGLNDQEVFPQITHCQPEKSKNNGLKPWVTLEEVIGTKSPIADSLRSQLDGGNPNKLKSPDDELHRINQVASHHLKWISGLPEGKSAFENSKCPICGFDDSKHNWKVDIRCKKCNSLLNKPIIKENGKYRLVKGFKTSYKRMKWNQPAPTVTCNSGTLSSDIKIHPVENRVLSLREIRILQTVDEYGHEWNSSFFVKPWMSASNDDLRDRRYPRGDKIYRVIVGEAIPPRFVDLLFSHIWKLDQEARRETSAKK